MAQQLESLIGHDEAVSYVRRVCGVGKPAHAYGIIGRAGVGSGVFARWFAGVLSGSVPVESRAVPIVSPPLIREFAPASEDGSWRREEVERIAHEFSLRGWDESGLSVVIIYGCDRMADDCAHALLKCLEEPRERLVILCHAHTVEGLLPTVRSRLVLMRLGAVARTDMEAYARELGIPEGDISWMVAGAGGCPGVLARMTQDEQYAHCVRMIPEMSAKLLMGQSRLSPQDASWWREFIALPDGLEHLAREVFRVRGGSHALATWILLHERMSSQHVPTRHTVNFLLL